MSSLLLLLLSMRAAPSCFPSSHCHTTQFWIEQINNRQLQRQQNGNGSYHFPGPIVVAILVSLCRSHTLLILIFFLLKLFSLFCGTNSCWWFVILVSIGDFLDFTWYLFARNLHWIQTFGKKTMNGLWWECYNGVVLSTAYRVASSNPTRTKFLSIKKYDSDALLNARLEFSSIFSFFFFFVCFLRTVGRNLKHFPPYFACTDVLFIFCWTNFLPGSTQHTSSSSRDLYFGLKIFIHSSHWLHTTITRANCEREQQHWNYNYFKHQI